NEILRRKAHTLSAEGEEILAKSSEATSGPQEIFSMFNNADIKFPGIEDEEGARVELTKGRYITFMESKDRNVRKAAFDALYDTYAGYKNTLAAAYTSSIKAMKFYSEARGYASSLEASLDADNITTDVYENLVGVINDNLGLLHRYVKVRAGALGMDKINMCDIYVPLVVQDDSKYTFEQACDTVAESLGALGGEYVSLLRKGFESGWIDVYENKGKTSGAYSWGTYMSHPFVLLNYQGTLDNIFTLAHEMGHSLHTYYSCATQPYIYSGYKIFVAEVASTVNEILMIRHMLAKTTDEGKRAYLINHFLETFRGTVFRQTMFAEFEKQCHGSYGRGMPMSGDDLCSVYHGLNGKYHGSSCENDEKIKYEWSRIPHYYRSFYVYKYATGFSAAAAIVKMIEEEGKPAVDRYMEFLKAGDSGYPLDILRKTGVDLSTPAPIEAGMRMFAELLDEFAAII
ncbi:MAG: oligoendopeptidase F, partial [Clostridia bacterium]